MTLDCENSKKILDRSDIDDAECEICRKPIDEFDKHHKVILAVIGGFIFFLAVFIILCNKYL